MLEWHTPCPHPAPASRPCPALLGGFQLRSTLLALLHSQRPKSLLPDSPLACGLLSQFGAGSWLLCHLTLEGAGHAALTVQGRGHLWGTREDPFGPLSASAGGGEGPEVGLCVCGEGHVGPTEEPELALSPCPPRDLGSGLFSLAPFSSSLPLTAQPLGA